MLQCKADVDVCFLRSCRFFSGPSHWLPWILPAVYMGEGGASARVTSVGGMGVWLLFGCLGDRCLMGVCSCLVHMQVGPALSDMENPNFWPESTPWSPLKCSSWFLTSVTVTCAGLLHWIQQTFRGFSSHFMVGRPFCQEPPSRNPKYPGSFAVHMHLQFGRPGSLSAGLYCRVL